MLVLRHSNHLGGAYSSSASWWEGLSSWIILPMLASLSPISPYAQLQQCLKLPACRYTPPIHNLLGYGMVRPAGTFFKTLLTPYVQIHGFIVASQIRMDRNPAHECDHFGYIRVYPSTAFRRFSCIRVNGSNNYLFKPCSWMAFLASSVGSTHIFIGSGVNDSRGCLAYSLTFLSTGTNMVPQSHTKAPTVFHLVSSVELSAKWICFSLFGSAVTKHPQLRSFSGCRPSILRAAFSVTDYFSKTVAVPRHQ